MKIALIQNAASFDARKNLATGLESARRAADNGADLIVFPELAFTKFFPQHRLVGNRFEHAEEVPGAVTDDFSELAMRHSVVVVLNLFERVGNRAYDSSPVIDADGSLLGSTRMIHITQYEGFFEQDYYDPGDTGAPVYETAAGKIGVAICYDRHYPEYLRALALGGADLVVVPQAGVHDEWPEGVFEAELQAAAFQNGYFMALANRVGMEEVLDFAGGSFVVDPFGQVLDRAPIGREHVLLVDVDLSIVDNSPGRTLFRRHRRPEVYETFVRVREV